MPKTFRNILGIMLLVLLVSGCAKGVKVQTYFEDKPRVDQDLPGNQGFLSGSTKAPLTERKLTRKVFVVEISKEAKIEETSQKTVSSPVGSTAVQIEEKTQSASALTTVEAVTPVSSTVATTTFKPSYVEYVVDKDDTLQKIAKKFYDNYNKWTKIYEANKSLIKNPDRIKPGITLRIPME